MPLSKIANRHRFAILEFFFYYSFNRVCEMFYSNPAENVNLAWIGNGRVTLTFPIGFNLDGKRDELGILC